MIKRGYRIIFFVFVCLFLFVGKSNGQEDNHESHIQIVMRMIGDEILNDSGDCTSRVLPIEKEGDQYRISFDSSFQFNPELLIATIQGIFVQTKIAESYMVRVEACDTKKIVYAYEIRNIDYPDMLPCTTRPQPKACYNLLVNILKPMTIFNTAIADRSEALTISKEESNSYLAYLLIIPLLAFGVFFAFSQKKKSEPLAIVDPNIISIGEYQFDKRNMELSLEGKKVELTGKEADLLTLLHTSANSPLEREVILKIVWGDEGDYVGRTLDVFISKLRKRLEGDSSVKIVNIRGVGYKLVVNG